MDFGEHIEALVNGNELTDKQKVLAKNEYLYLKGENIRMNEELSKLRQVVVSGRSEQLSDSLQDQIKKGELNPYSPTALWVTP